MAIIRKVQLQEVDLLRQISIRCFEETFAADNDPNDMAQYLEKEFNVSKLAAELHNPDSTFFFAMEADQICGYLKLNTGNAQTEKMPSGYLEVERIYVLKEWHGTGVGKQLLQKAFEFKEAHSLAYLWLGVWEHNLKAIRFYERNGFEVFGSHDFVLGRDVQKDLLMRAGNRSAYQS